MAGREPRISPDNDNLPYHRHSYPGPALIKPNQVDPQIKDQLQNTPPTTIFHDIKFQPCSG